MNYKTETSSVYNHHMDHINTLVTHIQVGFDVAPVVHIQDEFNHLEGVVEAWKEVISVDDFKSVYKHYETGTKPVNHLYEWEQSFYWCVRRANSNKLYPLPLVYSDATERQEAADWRNNDSWRMFYAGLLSSDQLQERLVDCPSCEEIEQLRSALKDWVTEGRSPWDDLDERGGMVPRWAA